MSLIPPNPPPPGPFRKKLRPLMFAIGLLTLLGGTFLTLMLYVAMNWSPESGLAMNGDLLVKATAALIIRNWYWGALVAVLYALTHWFMYTTYFRRKRAPKSVS